MRAGCCEYASFVFRRVEQTCFDIAILYYFSFYLDE